MARKIFILVKLALLVLLMYTKAKEIKLEEEFCQLLKIGEKAEAFIGVLFNFLIFALAFNLLVIFLSSVYRRRQGLKHGKPDNVLAGLENIYILVMGGAIVMTILSLFGVEPKSLFTGLSIVAAAIAIITKDFLANIISGIAISFSDEISIDDYIKIGEHKGKVLDISISRLVLLNDDDDIIFIPNNTVFISDIINYTKKGIRKVNIEFEVKTEYLNTVESLEKDLVKSLKEYHGSIEEGSYRLKIVEINKESLLLKFQYVLKEINRDLEREIRKKTVRQVVDHIRASKQ